MFDNGSELTLVSSYFVKNNKLPYEEDTYTLAGVGGTATVTAKTFSVKNILTERIGRKKIKFNPREFPHLSHEDLKEAGKPLPRRYLDVLVGNPYLGLQRVCNLGFGYPDCSKGRCLYRSRFRSGYVPLGSFGKDNAMINTVKHITQYTPICMNCS